MGDILVGDLNVRKLHFAVVSSRFHETVTGKLHAAAVQTLKHHGCSDENLIEAHVPGAFELPLAASELAMTNRVDAVIVLGCVIRGQTPHFDYICSSVSQALAQVALQTTIPVTFGVLTTDTMDQALERAGAMGSNKGAEAALAAIEMANLLDRITDLRLS